MRAIVMERTGGPDVLQISEADRPEPGPGQLLVEVAVAGVNYADVGTRTGMMHGAGSLPTVPGLEVAGTVRAAGPGATQELVGVRVAAEATAGYAEFAVVNAATTMRLPDDLAFAEGAALQIQGLTALGIVRSGRVGAGDTVLVTAAAGGVGGLAVQLARHAGAATVVGLASPGKLAHVKELGADLVVDYRQGDWQDGLRERLGGPVDVVLDAVGGRTSGDVLRLLAPVTGRMVVYGAASGPPELGVFDLIGPNLTLSGFSLQVPRAQPGWFQAASTELLARVAAGELRVPIGARVPLADAARAHELLESRQTTGKVVLDV